VEEFPSAGEPEAVSEEELLGIIDDEVSWAEQSRNARVESGDEAADYFYGDRPAEPADDCYTDSAGRDLRLGLSAVVSTDVQDAVYAVMAELLPAFTGSAPVEFPPMSEEDEAQADLETRATNQAASRAGIYVAAQQAVMDALLRKAGVIKVVWDERRKVVYDERTRVPPEEWPEAIAPKRPGELVELLWAEEHENGTASGMIRRTRTDGRPRIMAVPWDEFLISDELTSPNADEARFVAHQRPLSRSELIEMGASKELVDTLQETTDDLHKPKASHGTGKYRSSHPSTEMIMAVEAYYQIDMDGDGIAERIRVLTAGGSAGTDEMILWEPVECQPFATGVGYLGLFTWEGVSLFDRLRLVQELKTELLREMLNATKRSMRQRAGLVEGDANLDDWMASTLGGGIRMQTPNGIVPIQEAQLPASAFSLLEYLDGLRQDRGGGAVDATASAQVLGQGGDWSLERVMAATEQLNAMVAKNLVETLLKPAYLKLHQLLRMYRREPIVMPQPAGGWQETQPGEWRERDEMTITMGMSVGERSQRIAALQAVQQDHMTDAQAGTVGVLSSLQSAYRARVDRARLGGLPNPEQYYVDPTSQEAQMAQQQAAQQAEQQAMQQQQLQQQQMQYQYQLMTDIEKVKGEFKLAQQRMDEQAKLIREQMQMLDKLLGHRTKLAELEQKQNQAEAQREIDLLQAATPIRGGR